MIHENALGDKRYRVVINTFPSYPGVAHAEPGDIVYWWQANINQMALVRESDDKVVFSPPRRQNSYKPFSFPFVGVISENKSKGWKLEIEEIKD
ncbi:MAG: hypothetical protein GTO45_20445 [Candidatus Aminicenantes bacterium]|nr:hypothetical protein [Candidatus Aminicenantes bacterium]NIM82229.1 hypothetical protein [Candidatus Aminicenantes bacterium]NIN21631.1 hypothetical protein [Candidatus Aminicenantes bacterium]NIN44312.1 hypothetical protein [Candidatus Aminicenantes bacterium]NIN87131.1 hypothetical protein [Candidatus Aminicenantes bacterium]